MVAPRSEVLARVGRRLRQLREDLGRTQDEVGERSGFSGKYVSEIERGLRDPPLTTLVQLAERGLGVGVEKLVGPPSSVRPSRPNPVTPEPAASSPGSVSRAVQQVVGEIAALPEALRPHVLRAMREVVEVAKAATWRRPPRRKE
jgi:transcriptional regulator with XRE-family HTH domain